MSEKELLPTESHSPEVTVDFWKTQIEQAFETYRTLFSILVQAIAILGVANITLLGYAVSEKLAGVLLAGAIFPIAIWLTARSVAQTMLPTIYALVNLERCYGGEDFDWVASTFVSYRMSRKDLKELHTRECKLFCVNGMEKRH